MKHYLFTFRIDIDTPDNVRHFQMSKHFRRYVFVRYMHRRNMCSFVAYLHKNENHFTH